MTAGVEAERVEFDGARGVRIVADHWPGAVRGAARDAVPDSGLVPDSVPDSGLVSDSVLDSGPAAVLLAHGGGQTRHAWGSTAAALAGAGHDVWSIDLRGHGDSSWATDGDYTMQAFRDDALAVIESIGRPVAWVGASLGGMTALHAIDAAPDQFVSLTLVDITPKPAAKGVDRILAFMSDKAEEGFASLEEAADAIAAYQPHRPRPKDLSGLAKNLRRREDGRWRWHWDPAFLTLRAAPTDGDGNERGDTPTEHARDINHQRQLEIAGRLTLPVLLVRGRLSDLVTDAEVEEFRRLVPHASYVDVAGAGHMIAGDRNDAFTAAVVDFLAET